MHFKKYQTHNQPQFTVIMSRYNIEGVYMKYAMIALIALGLASLPGCTGCGGLSPSGYTQKANYDMDLVILYHNESRQSSWIYKTPKLKKDYGLMRAAQAHAEEMARRGQLSHKGINGSQVDDRVDYYSRNAWMTWGENIAWGQDSEREVVDGWMRSTGHKKNIMNKDFTHMGVGVAYDQNGRAYWCAVFAG